MDVNELYELKQLRNFAAKKERRARRAVREVMRTPEDETREVMLTKLKALHVETRKALNRATYALKKAKPKPVRYALTDEEHTVVVFLQNNPTIFSKLLERAEQYRSDVTHADEA